MWVTYIGGTRYSIDAFVPAFEYYAFSQSTYNLLKRRLSAKMKSKRKQLFGHSSFSGLAVIISDMYNFRVRYYHDAIIFFNNSCKLYSQRLCCLLEF